VLSFWSVWYLEPVIGDVSQSIWQTVIRQSADPERVERFLETLREGPAREELEEVEEEQARMIASVLAGSQALYQLLVREPEWIRLLKNLEALRFPRRREGLLREALALIQRSSDEEEGAPIHRLRRFKEREMLRIAARDLARIAQLPEIAFELTLLAEACLEAVTRCCLETLLRRYCTGSDFSDVVQELREGFSVIGLGKLGGEELNYHSDIDVMYLYEDSESRKQMVERYSFRGLSVSEFYHRLAERITAEVGAMTNTGQLYRIDLRLRPDAPHGPLAHSLDAAEAYYSMRGQTWERMMLIKARGVAGSPIVTEEFLEMIQPFRYPKSVGPEVLEDIARIKEQLEQEVVKKQDQDRDIKRGPGGIREVEFIVQALQLLHAGKNPFLQEVNTLRALERLERYNLLQRQDAGRLREAYIFLRELEHRLQMEAHQQTHLLPTDSTARCRLARLMDLPEESALMEALQQYRRAVREIYEQFIPSSSRRRRTTLPLPSEDPERWRALLERYSFRDPDHALQIAQQFIRGPESLGINPRVQQIALRLFQQFLQMCLDRERLEEYRRQAGAHGNPKATWLSDPDRVLIRLIQYMERYGARTTLLESWQFNQDLFRLLILLFDRSEFLAELALEEPDLVEDLLLGGYLQRRKSTEQILRELRYGMEEPDQADWIRRYHRSEFTRIGLRDILGLVDWRQSQSELTALAEACLQYSVEIAVQKAHYRSQPLSIIGLGKLGGRELNYGSDLDVLFLADNRIRDLGRIQQLGQQILQLISGRTKLGIAFQVDTRLRPDGEKGLLVNHLRAHQAYYAKRGRLWEIQALTRARPVAGRPELGHRFLTWAQRLVHLDRSRPPAAWSPHWKQEMHQMRLRIEQERTPAGKAHLSLKTGAGGLMDAEFIAQLFCLQQGLIIPNTYEALLEAQRTGWLRDQQAEELLENFTRLARIEAILRRWSYEAESELPDDPAALRRVAIRCGFVTGEDLLHAIQTYRQHIRNVYNQIFARVITAEG